MTNNPTNQSNPKDQGQQPFEAFRVQSPLLQNTAPAAAPDKQGSGDPGNPTGTGWSTAFGKFDWNGARWLVMPLFAGIYWATQEDPQLRPISLLVLLACLLLKMDSRARQVAGVPLTLAALKLVYQMAPAATVLPGTQFLLSENLKMAMTGLPWVPMFLAICIFYLPQRASVTGLVARGGAIALLISGLIPGDGYVVVLAMIHYVLFIGIVVGLIADFADHGNGHNGHRPIPPAHA
jgi:hypothetical protein